MDEWDEGATISTSNDNGVSRNSGGGLGGSGRGARGGGGGFKRFASGSTDENGNKGGGRGGFRSGFGGGRGGFPSRDGEDGGGRGGFGGGGYRGRDEEVFSKGSRDGEGGDGDADAPPRVTYVPPTPSEEDSDVFSQFETGINFDKYDNILVDVSGSNPPKAILTFEEAALCDSLNRNVTKSGYVKPTPVQKHGIPIILAGRDLMACAQTGSGKTAAFLLPILQKLMADGVAASFCEVQEPEAIIVAPTRELIVQIWLEARKFAFGTRVRPVYGGASTRHAITEMQKGCNVLCGTPGRLLDIIRRGKVDLSKVRYLVLDEADRMLNMGFEPDMRKLVGFPGMPPKEDRNTLMFSATYPTDIQMMAADFLKTDYLFLAVGMVGGACSDVEQVIVEVSQYDKRDKLLEILKTTGTERTMVFVDTKRKADFIATYLCQDNVPTTSIHGDREQREREQALSDFRAGRCPVLVATSVASRGLDIEHVQHVVNFDLPKHIDEYVHRIGRTGRCGNTGRAVTFYDPNKDSQLAPSLVKILSGAQQEVPKWLEDAAFGARDGEGGDGDADAPPRVTYVPPTPSEEDSDVFSQFETGINFDKYDNILVDVSGSNPPKAILTFEEAALCDSLNRNVTKSGYVKPTPVQKHGIPIILAGRDLMACAQTGSGKTAAFLLPILQKLMADGVAASFCEVQEPEAIIVAPTRELIVQIWLEARKFAFGTHVRPVVVYGGASTRHAITEMQKGCNVLCGTPGRLLELIRRGKVDLSKVRYLVLDEADRMLNMGFEPDMRKLVGFPGMPPKEDRNTLMFSATYPTDIQMMAADFLKTDYLFLAVGMVGGACSDVEQVIVEVSQYDKRDKLLEILKTTGTERTMVFVDTKRTADFIATYLCQEKVPTSSIHGDHEQREREQALSDFRAGRCPVLVATSVASRGLDIEHVQHVVNFDLPKHIDEYVHRIGRTGRCGNTGRAVTFYDPNKDSQLAPSLVKILSGAQQEVPKWLEDAAFGAHGTSVFNPDSRMGGASANNESRQQPAASAGDDDEAWD